MMKQYLLFICFALVSLLIHRQTVDARSGYWHLDTSGTCYSAVLDTGINPYTLGIASNWRPARTYVYYSSRKQSDAANTQTDIRNDGSFSSFLPFFKRGTGDSLLKVEPDTSVWVWNAQSTIFNIIRFRFKKVYF